VLVKLGADLNKVKQQVIQLLNGYQSKEPAGTASEGPPSDVARARSIRPQPHPGRSRRQARPRHRPREEIERLMQVLSRRTKNNPS
jgi:ATP-dependent Clp protease ATP-binding subunit ClpC